MVHRCHLLLKFPKETFNIMQEVYATIISIVLLWDLQGDTVAQSTLIMNHRYFMPHLYLSSGISWENSKRKIVKDFAMYCSIVHCNALQYYLYISILNIYNIL